MSVLLDAGLTLVALLIAIRLRPHFPDLPFVIPVGKVYFPSILFAIVPALWLFVFLLASVYDPRRTFKAVDEYQALFIGTGLAALVFAGLLYLFFRDVSRWLFISFVALDILLLVAWRAVARLVFKVVNWPVAERRVLVVGSGPAGRQVGQAIREQDWAGLRLVGFAAEDGSITEEDLPVLGRPTEVGRLVRQYKVDDVVVTIPQTAEQQISKLVLDLHRLPVQVRVLPDYFSLALYRAAIDDLGGMAMISLRDPALNDVQRLVKRLFDLGMSAVLTLFALPLMLLAAVAIRLEGKGPILFRQQRVGENGRLFTMYKFRSMVEGAEDLIAAAAERAAGNQLLHKRMNDPRVTRIGRLLRRASLDELPQLINVLRGDMSLVGPRPELPWLVDRYQPWQRKRFAVPQGITGWWQVNGRSSKPMHLHTEDDLYYVQNYSLWLDVFILIKTLFVVLKGKGAF
ncbi:MAG: sugar transferase [Candidatus Promineifilaceae bacterium]